jgi:hypothetical protein
LPKGISSLPAAFSAKAYCRYENDFAARLMIPFLEDSIKMRCRIMDCKKKLFCQEIFVARPAHGIAGFKFCEERQKIMNGVIRPALSLARSGRAASQVE